MSSLRRDLFERRLWPVIVVLLLAVIAVPLVLRKTASATVTPVPPAPPLAGATAPVQRATARLSVHSLEVSMPRDPFASGMPKLSAQPESKTGAASTSSATTTTSATTTSPSMVSPAPTTTSSSGSASSPAATTTPTTTTTTATTPTTTTTSATTTTTTTTSGSSFIPPVPEIQSWTVYAVDVRVGTGSFAPLTSDVARLTPLPSVAEPKAMFMGVLAGGDGAVFALGAGVQHVGPGVCRPDRLRCAAIELHVGQTEQLITQAAGGPRELGLSLVNIASRVTHSQDDALAAFHRHSDAGLCELDLSDPVTYSQGAGTVSAVTAAACKDQPAAVPFPGGLAAP
jgi:hypothetical protein